MTSHVPTNGGNPQSHIDGLAREGFPHILWEVLQGAGYATPPQYVVQLFEEHRVPRCRVRMTLEPYPLWISPLGDVLTTFCGFHPLEMSTHPHWLVLPMWKDRVEHAKDVWSLYPRHTAHLMIRCMSAMYRLQALRGEAMSQLMGLVESTKITLDNREDLVVDLSTKLVEMDLQVEQMANHIQELEDQVEARENTIEVLEYQLQTTQQQLEEANQHLDMHYQEIEDMEQKGPMRM
jgi:outer membrane murein-binding lipoprotein Lpp